MSNVSNQALAANSLRRIQFEVRTGLLTPAQAQTKVDDVSKNLGLSPTEAKSLSQTRYEDLPKAGGVKISNTDAAIHPVREGHQAAKAVKSWDEESGIAPKQQKLKQEHVAGKKKASQFTDAYPFVMMSMDLGVGGQYYGMSLLNPGQPSPDAVLVGDNHLTNSGSVPSTSKTPQIVYGIVDPTKAGVGRMETDLERLAVTSVITAAHAGELSHEDLHAIVDAAGRAYLKEMTRYVETGKKPNPYLETSELSSAQLADLLKSAGHKDPAKVVAKYCHGKEFKSEFKVDKKDADRVKDAFADYAQNNGVKLLDVGTKIDVGGSNSGMPHFMVLGEIGNEKYVFELKQMIPSPVEYTSGAPDKVDGPRSLTMANKLSAFQDPLVGTTSMKFKDPDQPHKGEVTLSYLIAPYDDREKTLDFSKPSIKELAQVASDTAALTARVHAQTVDLSEAKAWLKGLDTNTAVARLEKFANLYSQQIEADAASV